MTTNVFQALYGRRLPGAAAPLRHDGRGGDGRRDRVAAVIFGKLGSPGTVGWLGLMLVLYALLALFAWRPVSAARRRTRGPIRWSALASGAVTGITGIAAVPFLPYMQSLEISKNELIQGLGILFVFITAALAAALVQQDVFDTANLIGGVAAIVPTFVGVWIGQKVRHAASPETFRKIFLLRHAGARPAHGARLAVGSTAMPLPTHKVTICGIPELPQHCAAGVSHVLSIIDTHEPRPPRPRQLSRRSTTS